MPALYNTISFQDILRKVIDTEEDTENDHSQATSISSHHGLLLKIFTDLSKSQYCNLRDFFNIFAKSYNIQVDLLPSYYSILEEMKRTYPSNVTFSLINGSNVILAHQKCVSEPLDIMDLFKKRNSAMIKPNLCGYYFKLTEMVASELFHLKDIIMENCHRLELESNEIFTVKLKVSEDGLGSVVGVPSPRGKTKYKDKIFRCNLVILEIGNGEDLVFKVSSFRLVQ